MKLRNKKTGEIVERSSIVTLRYKISSSSSSLVEAEEFGSIEQLNEEWADYESAKPLIKDEKIRKAVRAWADANDIEGGITYLGDGEFRSYLNTTIDFAILVDEHRFDLLKKGEYYTITELCGEEEE